MPEELDATSADLVNKLILKKVICIEIIAISHFNFEMHCSQKTGQDFMELRTLKNMDGLKMYLGKKYVLLNKYLCEI